MTCHKPICPYADTGMECPRGYDGNDSIMCDSCMVVLPDMYGGEDD